MVLTVKTERMPDDQKSLSEASGLILVLGNGLTRIDQTKVA
jgi:hypothetical protein